MRVFPSTQLKPLWGVSVPEFNNTLPSVLAVIVCNNVARPWLQWLVKSYNFHEFLLNYSRKWLMDIHKPHSNHAYGLQAAIFTPQLCGLKIDLLPISLSKLAQVW